MELVLLLDYLAFFSINHLPHTPATDWIAQLVSGFESGWMIWIILAILLFYAQARKDHTFWIPIGAASILCFSFSEVLIKYAVSRERPAFLTNAIIVGMFPESFSFPSTHTTVAFAFAYLFSVNMPRFRKWFYLLAFLVAFSRIYLGHHYPLDVIAGGLLGTMIGVVSASITLPKAWRNRITVKSRIGRKSGHTTQ